MLFEDLPGLDSGIHCNKLSTPIWRWLWPSILDFFGIQSIHVATYLQKVNIFTNANITMVAKKMMRLKDASIPIRQKVF